MLKHLSRLVLILLVFVCYSKESVRIKDIASIKGIKENQIMGFGLVTGLKGYGDSKNFGLTKKMLKNLAINYGFNLTDDDIKSKNIAAVLVTASIGGFVRIGDSIDITVSSIGDAKSIGGGVLLQTALKGADGVVYAVAQGRIIGGSKETNTETSGSIPGGAVIEKEVVSNFLIDNKLEIVLNNPDFSTAIAVRDAVAGLNDKLMVKTEDPGLVEIIFPNDTEVHYMELIAQIEVLSIVPDYKAVVVIDKKSGIIVSGSDVIIQECSVSTPKVQVNIGGDKENNFSVKSTSVGDFVSLLNEADLSVDEIISLLESVYKAGALNAKLIIM